MPATLAPPRPAPTSRPRPDLVQALTQLIEQLQREEAAAPETRPQRLYSLD